MQLDRFFSELETRLEEARSADNRRIAGFFAELNPKLEAARTLERELNRHLAHQFNVFEYLKTDELGLSRVIADLLNPAASHGQGPLFLDIFLKQVKATSEWPDLDTSRATVVVEKGIQVQERKRFIDIYVAIPNSAGDYCLAIENKPYAGDQENQVKDYLEHLVENFQGRFLLIYLPPTGKGPSEESISRQDLTNERWRGRFAIMPYHRDGSMDAVGDDADGESGNPQADSGTDGGNAAERNESSADNLEDFQAGCTLIDWLTACREKCQVERLRWFLRDTELFCRKQFGDYSMTNDSEHRAVRKFLLSDTANWITAQAVYESFLPLKEEVCRKFLEHLRGEVEREAKLRLPSFAHDLYVGCKFVGKEKCGSCLWLYRTDWLRYQGDNCLSDSDRRSHISLHADGPGSDWAMGVCSPLDKKNMIEVDQKRRQNLDERLKRKLCFGPSDDGKWPQYRYVIDEFLDWNKLIPDLHRECDSGGGKITEHFVKEFVGIAEKAIPIINEIEGSE